MSKLSFSIEPLVLELIRKIDRFLSLAKVESYVVGGLVRDGFMGRNTDDIDIAVKADALEIARKFAEFSGGTYVLLDEENGIGRVVLSSKDSSSEHWEIDFSTIFGTINDDLSRRDFTIDAMAFPLSELASDYTNATLSDPFHGLDDLKAGLVRMVSSQVFKEDAVRLLRAARLAFELDFTIEKETEKQVSLDAARIADIPGERVREEFLRLLDVPKSDSLLPYLDRLGLLTAVIPELAETKGVTQPKEHHWNVFEHSLESVAVVDFLLHRSKWQYAGSEVLDVAPWPDKIKGYFGQEVNSGSTRRLILKVAALLHDIAKPQTKAPDETGRIRFLGHGVEGAEAAVAIMERLRFSTREIKRAAVMVKYHLRPGQMQQGLELPTSRAIYRYFRDTEGAGIDILYLNLADHLAARGPDLNIEKWREHCEVVAYMLGEYFRQEGVVKKEKLVSGDDLIEFFNLKPGPEIGRLLEKVKEAQAAGEISSRESALDYVRNLLDTVASGKDSNGEGAKP